MFTPMPARLGQHDEQLVGGLGERLADRHGRTKTAVDVAPAPERDRLPVGDGDRHRGREQLEHVVPGRPHQRPCSGVHVGQADVQLGLRALELRGVEADLVAEDLHELLDLHDVGRAEQVAVVDELGAVGPLAPDPHTLLDLPGREVGRVGCPRGGRKHARRADGQQALELGEGPGRERAAQAPTLDHQRQLHGAAPGDAKPTPKLIERRLRSSGKRHFLI